MSIIDTYEDMLTMFSDCQFNLERWRQYANHMSKLLAQKVEEDARNWLLPWSNTDKRACAEL